MNESKPNKSKHKNKVENNKKQSQSESKEKNGFISKTKKKETFKQCSILNYVVSQKREAQNEAEKEKEKETKKDENLENKKNVQKSKNKNKNKSKDRNNDRSKSKSKGILYVKKIVSKSKSKIINSKLSKRYSIDNINSIKTNDVKKPNDEMSSKESLNNSNDKILIDNKNDKDKGKNNDDDDGDNEKNVDNNLSQIANKNFNETLFDYKKYNLMNNPRKRKQEFNYELKKTKQLKDISMKKKKKGWIKKTFVDKEKKEKENEEKNDNKIVLQNKKNKNKNKKNMNNLNVINEEESTKKSEIKNNYFSDNKKEEENENKNENDYSELNMFNKMFKRSQDDFDIDLLSTSNVMNERNNIINDSETDNIINKYSDVKLRSRNANIEKDINYQNWKNNNNDDENEIILDEDINVNNKGRKNK